MSDKSLEMPKVFIRGLIPTLNNMGFMLEYLEPYSKLFIEHLDNTKTDVLDLGCAYGVATLAALEKGVRVTACDMEPDHLEILKQRCPDEYKSNLTCVVGVLPDVDFPDQSFDAIVCARVIHFLLGDDVGTTLSKIIRWLKTNGKLFLIADTPYSGPWKKGAPIYQEKKIRGEEWPGLIEDCANYLPPSTKSSRFPHIINLMDPDILRRECEKVGFIVERASFHDPDMDNPLDAGIGATHAGIVCRKP